MRAGAKWGIACGLCVAVAACANGQEAKTASPSSTASAPGAAPSLAAGSSSAPSSRASASAPSATSSPAHAPSSAVVAKNADVASSAPVDEADAGARPAGQLPPDVIQRRLRAEFTRFHDCYLGGLKKNPKLEGSVVLRFVIDPNGAVVSSQSESASSLPDRDVVTCIVRELKSIPFPKPQGGFVTVVYPIVLKPS